MLKDIKNKNFIIVAGCIVLFLILSVVYASPIFSDKALIQPDIVHYRGGAKELLDYRNEHGIETYWSNSMFGGMPTYQIGANFRGDIIKQIDYALNFLPRPANYLFLLFSGFFLLGMVTTRNWKYALLGASFFGLSTYFYIIIAAGHNSKVHTIAYFAPLLAGVLLVYIRRQYVWGFIVTALFMGLQIAANHPQMTYYLLIALGFLFISEFIRAVKKIVPMKHFLISSGVLALAFTIGVGMNSQRLMANSEYVKETTRGKQILNNDRHSSEKSGLDKASITAWSYGKLETLNLFIPRLMGGGSSEPNTEYMMPEIQRLVEENVSSQQEMDMISRGFTSLTYWGDQPGTSGPAYQGAVVVFLAVLGFFLASKKYKYWILGASILTVLLAWGENFAILTDFFIDFVPLYNKFRAPSSILVVVELLFPLIAILGLYQFFNPKKLTEQYKQKVLFSVSGATIGFILILMIFGKSWLGFYTANEKQYLPPYLLDYLVNERFNLFMEDVIKALIFVSITAIALGLTLKKKLSQNIALLMIGLVSLFDLWTVNKRYLNDSHYVDRAFAEHPYITENTEFLSGKAMENPFVQSILSQVNINKTLEQITEKDKAHYRIYNQTLGTFNETNTSFFKSSVGGYSAAKLRRYDDLINHYFGKMDTVKVPKILNMLNVKYMIFGDSQQPQPTINPYSNGNAWLVSHIIYAKSPNEEIDLIGTIDNKKSVVIDQKEFGSKLKSTTLRPDETANIQLTKYTPNVLEYQSQSKTEHIAVFSEIYYPYGWKAFVDNKEVDIIRSNYLLRAIVLPAGKHHIKMVFEPEVISKGKTISIIAFIVFILLSLVGIFYHKRESNC